MTEHKHVLTTAQADAVYAVAEWLYEKKGSKGVHKLARLLDWIDYCECGMCDTVVPRVYTSAGDTCLVCGSDDLGDIGESR
jgi:hypothetical protein